MGALTICLNLPVYNEDAALLDQVLASIFAQTRLPNRVVVLQRSVLLEGAQGGAFGGEVFIIIIGDLNHRSVHAGAQTLDFDDGELLVGRRFAETDTELFLAGRDNAVRPHQPARRRRGR